jgi:hypothetical protein
VRTSQDERGRLTRFAQHLRSPASLVASVNPLVLKTLAWTLTLAAAALAAMEPATADPRSYVNASGDSGTATMPDCDGSLGLGLGSACFPAGHVQPDADGTATITLTDSFLSPVSGVHCDDADGDSICEQREIGEWFCGTHTIRDGEDWHAGDQIIIVVDGPVFGNPILSPCGTLSTATTGIISHS